MAFAEQLPTLLERPTPLMRRLGEWLGDTTPLEALASRSQQLTRRHFGRTMRLFAPLYLSNECTNGCRYGPANPRPTPA